MKSIFKFIRYFIIFILSFIMFISLYIMYSQVFLSTSYPILFGIGRDIITDDNTSANFKKDDYILTLSADNYKVGDIVVYTTLEGEIMSDTISEISENTYYFENGGNTQYSINGKVIFIFHGIGSYMLWIESPCGTIIILTLIILIVEIPHLIEYINRRGKERNYIKY